ncbi:MAG: acyl-CoA dehydrogenase family protein, partial [Acidimicrobiia bacterium]|nr:acyl-CoA dehydrogenase family protein [Acidimicrobiia bacterium]
MDFAYTEEDEAFRTELRTWLDANLPDFMDGSEIEDPQSSANLSRRMVRQKSWQRRMNEGRWAAINWPRDWGGREATIMQNVIYSEEMAKAKAPGIFNPNGIWQIGPMIIKWGTDEQKDLWLRGIINADVHWCQGFTEPEAGSDLANLRTMALRDGDEYVLNGQKIFISTAHIAKWGLFLVRTDPDAISEGRKHEGITALIVDMEAPGIDVRPIPDITREEMFCEVFFTDARVPVKYRLGEEGQGWLVAMGTLGHERVGTAGLSISMRIDLDNMIAATKKYNPEALDDPDIRDRIARVYTQLEFTRLLNARALSKV